MATSSKSVDNLDTEAMKDEGVTGLDDEGDREIVLTSQEGEKFPIKKKVATMSELVKTMAEGGLHTMPYTQFFYTHFLQSTRVRFKFDP